MADRSQREARRTGTAVAQDALVSVLATADRVRAFIDAVVAPLGITGQQYNVLRILRGAGPAGLATLTVAARMIDRAPGITRMIDRLEAKKLVERHRSTADRRLVTCRITAKGIGLLEQLDDPISEANRAALSPLTAREMELLAGLLNRVCKAHESARAKSKTPGRS